MSQNRFLGRDVAWQSVGRVLKGKLIESDKGEWLVKMESGHIFRAVDLKGSPSFMRSLQNI